MKQVYIPKLKVYLKSCFAVYFFITILNKASLNFTSIVSPVNSICFSQVAAKCTMREFQIKKESSIADV